MAGKVWWAARDVVNSYIQERFKVHQSGRVLEFSQGGVPWKEHLFELEAENNLGGDSSILYVIYRDQAAMWRVQCVPTTAKSFTNRLSLPQEWRGLRDAELEKVSGISGTAFVHSNGFIGGNKTREGELIGICRICAISKHSLLSVGILAMTEAALKTL